MATTEPYDQKDSGVSRFMYDTPLLDYISLITIPPSKITLS